MTCTKYNLPKNISFCAYCIICLLVYVHLVMYTCVFYDHVRDHCLLVTVCLTHLQHILPFLFSIRTIAYVGLLTGLWAPLINCLYALIVHRFIYCSRPSLLVSIFNSYHCLLHCKINLSSILTND